MGPTALSHLVIHATVLLLEKIKTSTKKTSKNAVKMGRHVASPGAEAFSSYINGVFSLDLLLFHVESDRFSWGLLFESTMIFTYTLIWSPNQDAMYCIFDQSPLIGCSRTLGPSSLCTWPAPFHRFTSQTLQQLAPTLRFRSSQSSLALTQPPVATPHTSTSAAKGGNWLVSRNSQWCCSLSFLKRHVLSLSILMSCFTALIFGGHLFQP